MRHKKPDAIIPYKQEGSIVRTAFVACVKGIKERKLVRLVMKMKGDPARMLAKMRRGYGGDCTWEVEEENGRIKITNVQRCPSAPPQPPKALESNVNAEK